MRTTQTAHIRRQPKKPGFTLIELLVVMTVIGILVGMLFPALGAFRRKGERAKCVSNLRQITQGGLLFASEYSGNLPYRYTWAYSNAPTPFCFEGGELYYYVKKKEVLRCPSDQVPGDACDAWKVGTYVLHVMTNTTSRYNLTTFKANDVFFFEGNAKNICNRNDLAKFVVEDGDPRVLGDRHAGGGHVSCFDGHVEWMSVKEWLELAQIGGGLKNRLWPLGPSN
jgi:prepilin-type N-terminal cleavage/methylation domain-containing protein/prepilin-type processing-associated H-X9-DG protein